jgi:hypothetical protein
MKYQNIDISMFVMAEISVLIRGDHCVGYWTFISKQHNFSLSTDTADTDTISHVYYKCNVYTRVTDDKFTSMHNIDNQSFFL